MNTFRPFSVIETFFSTDGSVLTRTLSTHKTLDSAEGKQYSILSVRPDRLVNVYWGRWLRRAANECIKSFKNET